MQPSERDLMLSNRGEEGSKRDAILPLCFLWDVSAIREPQIVLAATVVERG